ncbi:mpv17-like protein 2 [Leguminivora glycinivorella]|uniref:mpv17-like protein 2 n=1 Tax=Leguminivora glycinivorella TaxID=1035111 RepID=UPI00200E9B16|nr:mpv17-like protein 2 [Leguminivora glycinivorella]XP_047993265.1 mpv17-like protein 2 [Leguminivora glycinivorella]XP_047993266.1 mpv17-like protein 2 [Leguminivora glycinivorella]
MQSVTMGFRRLMTNFRGYSPVTKFRNVVKVAFSDKYLLYTNVTISLSLSALGDIAEQSYELYCKDLQCYDSKRTLHMACSGVAVGILCHNWYKVLDKFIIGKTFDMVVKKLLLDQFIFSPIMIVTFFGSLALFEEHPLENFKEEVKGKFVTLYQAEWVVWPPAQIINFYFLPTRYRVLYDNTISLGYDIYTSQVKHGKGKKIFLDSNGKKPDSS